MRGMLLGALLLAGTIAQPAKAAWHKVSTRHFIIYADDDPQKLGAFATRLEKFDRAVRLVRKMKDEPVGDGNRLTVYVVKDMEQVGRLIRNQNAGGFYIGRVSGPLAVVPKNGGSTWEIEFTAETIFFHEYAHHLMFQVLDSPLPEWVVEGFAEMMSTASFEKDGAVWLGRVAKHRSMGLFWGESMPLETLLSANYGQVSDGLKESIYGRGWLLTHYLTFAPERKGQLDRYIALIGGGNPPLDAAKQAFGDLRALDRDLTSYRLQRKVSVLQVPPGLFPRPEVTITPLSPGAAEVMPLRLQSKVGVDRDSAEPLAVKVRQISAGNPGDPLVEITLAEAELDAGHLQASEAAADRALAADPTSVDAMLYKGLALIRKVDDAARPDARLVGDARDWFLKAHAADPQDPEPLFEYFRSYLVAGEPPTAKAIDALHRASGLVPQDSSLRLMSAYQYLRDKDLKMARQTMAPVAYDPHSAQAATIARSMIERIDAGDIEGALKAGKAPQKDEPEGSSG
jgi:tetratricopeptide (TPR) repeat protein